MSQNKEVLVTSLSGCVSFRLVDLQYDKTNVPKYEEGCVLIWNAFLSSLNQQSNQVFVALLYAEIYVQKTNNCHMENYRTDKIVNNAKVKDEQKCNLIIIRRRSQRKSERYLLLLFTYASHKSTFITTLKLKLTSPFYWMIQQMSSNFKGPSKFQIYFKTPSMWQCGILIRAGFTEERLILR